MSFVYEEVGEENRELWEKIGFKTWGKKPVSFYRKSKWCIDRERDYYFYKVGAFRFGGVTLCELSYESRIIKIDLTRYLFHYKDVLIEVERVIIPGKLRDKIEDIKKVLDEAFVCNFETDERFNVSIKYLCEMEVEEE